MTFNVNAVAHLNVACRRGLECFLHRELEFRIDVALIVGQVRLTGRDAANDDRIALVKWHGVVVEAAHVFYDEDGIALLS